MSNQARILVGIGAAVVVIGIYLWLFGVQTMSSLWVRYKFREIPEVAQIPVALTDVSVSPAPHKKLSNFGYELELPWDDVDEQKSKNVGTICVTAFHSGNAFSFSTFPPKAFVNGVMDKANLDPARFRQIFGDDAFQSDYGFMSEMLQVTPKQISPFESRNQAVVGSVMLLLKAISMAKADSGIFSIRSQVFQGFQFGNPQSRPPKITAELYSNDGGVDLIFFGRLAGAAPRFLSQRLTASFKVFTKFRLGRWRRMRALTNSRNPSFTPQLGGTCHQLDVPCPTGSWGLFVISITLA